MAKKYNLPRNIRYRPMANGQDRFYWELPTKDRKRGCPIENVTLGSDPAHAIKRGKELNQMLYFWRKNPTDDLSKFIEQGTIQWLHEEYLKSDAFLIKVKKRSHRDYRQTLDRLASYRTKDGSTLGRQMISGLDGAAARKVYYKIVGLDPVTFKPVVDEPLYRTGELVVTIAAKAWNVVRGDHPQYFSKDHPNPWEGVALIKRKRKTKPHVDRETVYRFADGAYERGFPTVGAAAIVCYEWVMRPENLLSGQLKWSDYRGHDEPDRVIINHGKTESVSHHILFVRNEDGEIEETFYDDAVAYFDRLERGPEDQPIILDDKGRLIDKYRMSRTIRKLRDKIDGVPDFFTLDACRHGGMTELEERGLTEGEGRTISAHKTATAYRGYAKETDVRMVNAQRKRFGK